MRHWILACRLRHCARAKSLFPCQRIAIINSRNTRRRKVRIWMQSRGIFSGKNKNTVHEKKPPSGKRKRSHTSSLFFFGVTNSPLFHPYSRNEIVSDDEDENKGGSETAITIVRSQGTGIIGGVALLPLWQFSPLSILGMCYSAREACSHLPFLRQSRADNECPTCRGGRRRRLWTSGGDGNDSPSTQEQTYQKICPYDYLHLVTKNNIFLDARKY